MIDDIDIGPSKASPGRPFWKLGVLVVVVLIAACRVALAAGQAPRYPSGVRLVPTQPEWRGQTYVAESAPVAGPDDRFIHPAPEGIDPRFAVQGAPGLDDGILVAPSRLVQWTGPQIPAPPRLRIVPAPRLRLPGPRVP